jgi:hypothetical protein
VARVDVLRLHRESEINKMIAKTQLSAPMSRHLGQLKSRIIEESTDNRTITYKLQREILSGLPDLLMDYLWH